MQKYSFYSILSSVKLHFMLKLACEKIMVKQSILEIYHIGNLTRTGCENNQILTLTDRYWPVFSFYTP